MEDVNRRRRKFLSLSKLECSLRKINSTEIRLRWTFSALPSSKLNLPNCSIENELKGESQEKGARAGNTRKGGGMFGPPCSPVPFEKWFLQAGRYATKGEKPLRVTICFFDRAAVQRYGRIN